MMTSLTRRIVSHNLLLSWRITNVLLLELVEELVDLDAARELDIFVRELLREVLLHVHELIGLGWLLLDLILGGVVAPQVLDLHGVVVLGIVLRHLVLVGVYALALPLHVVVVIAVLVLAQRRLGFDDVVVLESCCRVEGCGLLDDLGAQHVEEYSMSVYLSQRWCSRSVDLSGSALMRTKWKKSG